MSKQIEQIQNILCDPDIHPVAADVEIKDVFSSLAQEGMSLYAQLPLSSNHMFIPIDPIPHTTYLLNSSGRLLTDQELHTPFAGGEIRHVKRIVLNDEDMAEGMFRLNVHVAPDRKALVGVVIARQPFLDLGRSLIDFSTRLDTL